MKKILTTILISLTLYGFSQPADTLNLQMCYDSARLNYPLLKQKILEQKSFELKQESLNTNYYPQLNLNANASYQSEVTTVEMNIPDNPYFSGEDLAPPPIAKDWYNVTLDINQIIYDGGMTKSQKSLEESIMESNLQKLEVDFYKVKERINELYFSVLLLQKSKEQIVLLQDNLYSQEKEVASGVKNGVVLESNLDILKAEIISIDQQLIELQAGINAGLQMLEQLMLIEIPLGTILETPEAEVNTGIFENLRPEYQLISIQQEKLNKMEQVLSAARMPKFIAYGQAGYGRPGLNMLSDKFEDYYKIGARVSWNICDWNKTKTEKNRLAVQHDILDVTKETLDHNLKVSLARYRSEITKYEELLIKDTEIISLRSDISEKAFSQLSNGVITSTEYLIEVNAEKKALLNKQKHEVLLIQAKLDYLTAIGKM